MEDEQAEGKGDVGVRPRRTGAWPLAEHRRGLLESRGVASRRAWVWPTGEHGYGLLMIGGVASGGAGACPFGEQGRGLLESRGVASLRGGAWPPGEQAASLRGSVPADANSADRCQQNAARAHQLSFLGLSKLSHSPQRCAHVNVTLVNRYSNCDAAFAEGKPAGDPETC